MFWKSFISALIVLAAASASLTCLANFGPVET